MEVAALKISNLDQVYVSQKVVGKSIKLEMNAQYRANFPFALIRVKCQINLAIVYFGWVIFTLPVDSSYSPISMISAGDFVSLSCQW